MIACGNYNCGHYAEPDFETCSEDCQIEMEAAELILGRRISDAEDLRDYGA
jgi:hypothetical protein